MDDETLRAALNAVFHRSPVCEDAAMDVLYKLQTTTRMQTYHKPRIVNDMWRILEEDTPTAKSFSKNSNTAAGAPLLPVASQSSSSHNDNNNYGGESGRHHPSLALKLEMLRTMARELTEETCPPRFLSRSPCAVELGIVPPHSVFEMDGWHRKILVGIVLECSRSFFRGDVCESFGNAAAGASTGVATAPGTRMRSTRDVISATAAHEVEKDGLIEMVQEQDQQQQRQEQERCCAVFAAQILSLHTWDKVHTQNDVDYGTVLVNDDDGCRDAMVAFVRQRACPRFAELHAQRVEEKKREQKAERQRRRVRAQRLRQQQQQQPTHLQGREAAADEQERKDQERQRRQQQQHEEEHLQLELIHFILVYLIEVQVFVLGLYCSYHFIFYAVHTRKVCKKFV